MGEKLKIEEWPIDKIIPYRGNAKKHPEEQVEQIADSIRRFGNNDPIAVNAEGVIIEGHGRLLALKKLGAKTAPVIQLKGLTKEQEDAYRLVHNQLTMNSGWDYEALAKAIDEIKNIDMKKFGFDDKAIQRSLAELRDKALHPFEDDPEDLNEKAQVKRGDIWLLGKHRLMCGDCIDPKDVARLMVGAKARMALTDPPYNVGYEAKGVGTDYLNYEDKRSKEEYGAFLFKSFKNMASATEDNAAFYVWFAFWNQVETEMEKAGILPRQSLCWVKSHFVLGRSDYQWKHEECFYAWKYEKCIYGWKKAQEPDYAEALFCGRPDPYDRSGIPGAVVGGGNGTSRRQARIDVRGIDQEQQFPRRDGHRFFPRKRDDIDSLRGNRSRMLWNGNRA